MPAQILLFDYPRSANHLLQRILSKQPTIELLYDPYSACRGKQVEWLISEDWENGMSKDIRSAFEASIQGSTEMWREELTQCQEDGKTLMIFGHPFSTTTPEFVSDFISCVSADKNYIPPAGNFTSIPDDLLLHRDSIPVFTIRNPRLSITSAFRTLGAMGLPHGSGRANFLITTSTLWLKLLYDFFVSKNVEPLIIDADDLMTDPDFSHLVCEKLGLDSELVVLDWEPVSEREKALLHPMFFASQRGLLESKGVDAGRAAKNIDLVAEEDGWEDEFGGDAVLIREMVGLAMPWYEYLRGRRLRK